MNNIRKSLFLISFFLLPLLSFAQMTVESVKELPTDLSAKTNKRLDLNGKSCALVKIEMRSPEAKFEGNVIGEVDYNTSEYLVYLSPGTKTLKMSHPNQTPVTIDFEDYGISGLSEGTTYSVLIRIVDTVVSEEIIPFNDPCVEMGHKWVDLGLSVKWAQCNIGAKIPTETGQYFAWGERMDKDSYSPYNSETANTALADIGGTSEHDVAAYKWKGTWRMPTASEFQELKSKCQWRWKSRDGLFGFEIIGPNGNSIFLPAAGVKVGSELKDLSESGDYWSSTPQPNRNSYSFLFDFSIDEKGLVPAERHIGASVRPVINK